MFDIYLLFNRLIAFFVALFFLFNTGIWILILFIIISADHFFIANIRSLIYFGNTFFGKRSLTFETLPF